MISWDYNIILTAVIISLVLVLIQLWIESRKKPLEKEYATKTLLKCIKCGYTLERDFEPGDFITMIKYKCPKCGNPMRIEAIYAIEKAEQYKRKT